VREQIIDFLRRELIGPDPIVGQVQENGEEIITRDPPRLRYSAGVLFPRNSNAVVSQDLSPGDHSDDHSYTPETPEIEAAGATAWKEDFDDEEEAIEDDSVSLANATLPSAIGFSCFAELPETEFLIRVSAATYRSEKSTYTDSQGNQRPDRRFLRTPLQAVIAVDAGEFKADRITSWQRDVLSDGQPSGLQVRILSRPRKSSVANLRLRILTFSLVNTFVSPGRPESDQCFFQVGLVVRGKGDSNCFLEYPEREGEERWHDKEERALALLYRHRKTFAIGHGCAAEWLGQGERAVEIRTETLPVHEVKPIVPSRISGLEISMAMLGNEQQRSESLAVLRLLCTRYEDWIGERETELQSTQLKEEYRDAARSNISDCRKCLGRMRTGVGLLEKDPLVYKAFSLANTAMLMQQLHYGAALREWKSDEGKLTIAPWIRPDYTKPPEGKGRWHPFQIAFILMNLEGIADPERPDRGIVDLIWFPTGGGKTEAYLGLSAFTIFLRRLRKSSDAGTTVLMRYTLRLLTAQQFQRAASLICAMERIRVTSGGSLGEDRISIGLWVGRSLTPNKRQDAVAKLAKLNDGRSSENPLIVLKCPWCGAQMGPSGDQGQIQGYEKSRNPVTVIFKCKYRDCEFSREPHPLVVIDEDIYSSPPTLLIGTVDKFAMLPWRPEGRALFGIGSAKGHSPPDLVIQDELHLISGPLGSMVGHYETLLDELCSRKSGARRIRAKVVASTATICRAPDQVKALYNRDVCLFPPQCLRAGVLSSPTKMNGHPGDVMWVYTHPR
jgi:hypothetical protein